jgi:hypothetical protein
MMEEMFHFHFLLIIFSIILAAIIFYNFTKQREVFFCSRFVSCNVISIGTTEWLTVFKINWYQLQDMWSS